MPKTEREHGYQDGRRYAEEENKDNLVESIIRGFSDAIISPKSGSSEDYERGWREGVEDGKRK